MQLSRADRSFMERAVRAAGRSVHENDNRPHPNVGVVIVKDGRILAVGHRGERKRGEHAEFTALERKLARRSLAGATVFTTLEPCTTRRHPKVPCAKRLVERKVRCVVVGQLDPNQAITGKGILALRKANVEVSLFPPDLMARLEELNRDFLRCHSERELTPHVAILVSAFQRKAFFAELLHKLLLNCAARGYDGVVKLPGDDYSPSEQRRQLCELLEQAEEYVGAIVVPVEPESTQRDLAAFVAGFQKPVVFLDVDPFPQRKLYPANVCFVGYNNRIGGQVAARVVARQLKGAVKPRVLAIGAEIQTERQMAFASAIERLIPGATVEIRGDGGFDREAAKCIAHDILGAPSPRPFAAVFATNDEMALGVLDACRRLPPASTRQLVIVGFDGIPEAREQVRSGGSQLVATVVQDNAKLAQEALLRLHDRVEGRPRRLRTLLVPTAFITEQRVG